MGKVRAFVAINLPDEVRKQVAEIQRELKSICADDSVRWTAPEQIHLTLKFLPGVESSSLEDLKSAIQLACHEINPFEMSAQKLGCFPTSRRPRIIWIGINGDLRSVAALQQRIDEATKSWREPEARDFHPHLTMGRVKNLRPRESRALSLAMESYADKHYGSWRVTEVDLMQSKPSPRGSSYSKLASFALGS